MIIWPTCYLERTWKVSWTVVAMTSWLPFDETTNHPNMFPMFSMLNLYEPSKDLKLENFSLIGLAMKDDIFLLSMSIFLPRKA